MIPQLQIHLAEGEQLASGSSVGRPGKRTLELYALAAGAPREDMLPAAVMASTDGTGHHGNESSSAASGVWSSSPVLDRMAGVPAGLASAC